MTVDCEKANGKNPQQIDKNVETDVNDDDALDAVLAEIGEFSVYQLVKYVLIVLPIALSAVYAISFIVTGVTLDYR